MIKNPNNKSKEKPKLQKILNLGTLSNLPSWSSAPKLSGIELLHALKDVGYEGIQGGDPKLCGEVGLTCSGSFRLNEPKDANDLVIKNKEKGFNISTIHVGWGMESDDEIDRLIGSVINASVKNDTPVYIETHRATITQDIWRTVQMTKRNPEIKFNGDFSHWYTGLEMPYGSMADKLEFLSPIFERVRFFHGRIGNSSHMQINFKPNDSFVQDFKNIWTLCMIGFLKSAGPGDYLPFAPELLSANYARVFNYADGERKEESDRWEQALLMIKIAQDCFDDALKINKNNLIKNI